MVKILQPENGEPDRVLRDLERRVAALERTQRVGLHRARFARATAAASPTTFGTWETGSVGNTWADDRGATGTGYPTVTVKMGSRALILMSAAIQQVGSDPTQRSSVADFGIGINGATPAAVPAPVMFRRYFQPALGPAQQLPVSWFVLRSDFTPESDTVFQVSALWNNANPAAATQPLMTDSFVLVVPLD